MSAPTQVKIIIVGGGAGGSSTFLHIAQLEPSQHSEILILATAKHPRPKLCGGGVMFHAEEQLRPIQMNIGGHPNPVSKIRDGLAALFWNLSYLIQPVHK